MSKPSEGFPTTTRGIRRRLDDWLNDMVIDRDGNIEIVGIFLTTVIAVMFVVLAVTLIGVLIALAAISWQSAVIVISCVLAVGLFVRYLVNRCNALIAMKGLRR